MELKEERLRFLGLFIRRKEKRAKIYNNQFLLAFGKETLGLGEGL